MVKHQSPWSFIFHHTQFLFSSTGAYQLVQKKNAFLLHTGILMFLYWILFPFTRIKSVVVERIHFQGVKCKIPRSLASWIRRENSTHFQILSISFFLKPEGQKETTPWYWWRSIQSYIYVTKRNLCFFNDECFKTYSTFNSWIFFKSFIYKLMKTYSTLN